MRWGEVLRRVFIGAPSRTFHADPTPVVDAVALMQIGNPPRASRDEALSVPAMLRARNMICSISTLPLEETDRDNRPVRSPLLDQIDPDVPNVVTMAQTVEDLLFEAIAWWRVLRQDDDGFPVKCRHLDPAAVSLHPPSGPAAPLPSGENPRGATVWVDGKPVPASLMIRFDSPNPGVLRSVGRTVKRSNLLDQTARMYAESPRPMDYFTTEDGGDDPDDKQVETFLGKWLSWRRRRSTAWVPGWAKYNAVESPTPADLQLVELIRQATLDTANAVGVDPEDLGVSTTSRTYQNAVDRRVDRINEVLAPYMRAVTDRLSMNDVTRRGHQIRFDLDDYMKSNPTERWNVYKIAEEMGATDVEEIRDREGWPARAVMVGAAPARAAAAAADSPPALAAAATTNVIPLAGRFAGPELRTFDLPVRGFTVDTEQRIIEGLAVPFGQQAEKYGVRVRFAPGSLKWSDPKRVKLTRDHDYGRAIGYAMELAETSDGYRARFKVARGADGDEALQLAEDGVLDGLSIGVEFDMVKDTVADPNDPGGLVVVNAPWRETALTAVPAFDDARLTRVAASANGGDVTQPTQAPAVAAPAAPAPAADAPNEATMREFRRMLEAFHAPQVRAVVDPAAGRRPADVTDPEPYRFDRRGNLRPGAFEFSADIFAGWHKDGTRDPAAQRRVMEFITAQFDVITSDVNELNPSPNRPEMYVDQRDYLYPVWSAIEKGTLTNITPFTFPKFSSAAGLVGNHTEGTEPTSGTFVTTSQTVTPTAVSGKAKISRETWDQGGNPQIGNLIWRQMLKGWFEALEAAAVAVLDAATPTGITLTAGGGTTGQTAVQELTAAIVALQYVRGGYAFTDGFAQIDLYKVLAGALDNDKRPLLPILGPVNADGTMRPRGQAIDVAGVQFLPAWALAATGVVAASSYLFDRESVHGWASTPERLTIDDTEVANVYIGLWGYKATAISDVTGVREVIYDPVP